LKTWEPSFRNRKARVRRLNDQFYTPVDTPPSRQRLPRGDRAFDGKTYLLVNAANSSATFNLARIVKDKLGTLLGRTTGGNQKGITGGEPFFLHLPNSKVERDIPPIGYYPLAEQPNRGIRPDGVVKKSVEDATHGVDTELNAVLALTKTERLD
jgi:hypothetical protein